MARGGTGGRSGAAKGVKSERMGDGNGSGIDLSALQEQLTRQLQQTVEDTVGAVCDEFQHDMMLAQAKKGKGGGASSVAPSPYGAASTADYEIYYNCCSRLVAYIAANMATSPDFVPQMERIILACHSSASERVLRSVATKNVWFHRRDGAASDGIKESAEEEEDDEVEVLQRSTRAAANNNGATAKKTGRATKKEPVHSARPTRTVTRKTAEAPPPRASKRRSPAVPEPPMSKRLRPARRSLPIPAHDDEEEEEGEEEEEEEVDDGNERYDKDSAESATNQPHYEVADELLDFKDPVRDLCYVDKRTPAQTKFFKERLRKAIVFVDAQLCKPPPGKVCGRDCKKIRAVMCDRNLPCRNKICRVWHDVEVHIDRCQNTHCELKNRIMLRETMHKIEHKKLQIHNAKLEVQAKKKERDETKNDESNEREQFIELTLLNNEISELEGDIAAAEEELGILNGTQKAFWACLNVVGIEPKDDAADGFPDLAAHYVNKKQAASRTRAPKSSPRDQESFSPEKVVNPPRGRRSDAHAASTMNENADMSRAGPMAPITRRTTRRSTTKTFEAMSMDVINVESDEEKKTEEADGQRTQGGNDDEVQGENGGEHATNAQNNAYVSDAVGQSAEENQPHGAQGAANVGNSPSKVSSGRQSTSNQDLNDTSSLLPQTLYEPEEQYGNKAQQSQASITTQTTVSSDTVVSTSSQVTQSNIQIISASQIIQSQRANQNKPTPATSQAQSSNIQLISGPLNGSA
ncbi:hypothetical protein FI667_g11353, partial [Globisporangium splendens]